jgi:hypothetical protein
MCFSPGVIVSPCKVNEQLDDVFTNDADRHLRQDDLFNLQVTAVAPYSFNTNSY